MKGVAKYEIRTDKWYEDNKEKIKELYDDGYGKQYIADMVQCGAWKLWHKIKEWGWEPHKPSDIKRKERYNAICTLNVHYFDKIDTEHKAYWLGFLLADGHISNTSVMIGLQLNDEYIIKEFLSDLHSNHHIRYDKHGNPNVSISCRHMCEVLHDYGLNHRKSYWIDIDKISSVIPKELIQHFIRGMFDGDGSIKTYHYSYQKTTMHHFGYTGTYDVCMYIKHNLTLKREPKRERNTNTYTIRESNPVEIMRIYNYLYKDATIFIQRKYDVFQQIPVIYKQERGVNLFYA